MGLKPIRVWDAIDKAAAAEGFAISRMNSYRIDDKSDSRVPKRLFTNGVCFAIERMSAKEYKKLLNRSSILY